jgi:endoglucanase
MAMFSFSRKSIKYLYILWIVPVTLFTIKTQAQTPVELHGALRVEENMILDKNDEAVSLAGNCLFWSNTGWGGDKFYNADAVAYIKTWNASIIRASMGVDGSGGYLTDASNEQRVKTVVDAAIDEGLYVLIDWHTHRAENYVNEAVDFFKEMATLYGDTDNVLYEIYNEPLQVSWSNVIKPYADTVIKAIRAIDPDNIIVVGTPNWSQYVDEASEDPLSEFDNIAYAAHFYAGTHNVSLRTRISVALNNGIAVMITEWGTVDASGDGEVSYNSTNAWMDYIKEKKLSHCNWALNDKDEGASFLLPGSSAFGGWTEEDLTPSGSYVKQIIIDWHTDTVYNHPPIPGEEPDTNPVSLENRNTDNGNLIKVYTPSSSDNIYIDLPEEENVYSVELINELGQTIESHTGQELTERPIKLWVNRQNNSPVYWIRIVTQNGSYVKSFIKK